MAVTSPFTLDEARRSGLTRRQLAGRKWRRLGPKVYAARELADDPLVALKAATRRLPTAAVFSGRTAAFLHRLVPQCLAIEAILPLPTRISRRVGITIRRCQLSSSETVLRQGFRVTSAVRTVVDLATRLDLVEAVVILDAALHKRLIRLEHITPRDGQPGVRKLRRAISLAEPAAESPMETRLRLLLVFAGLPRPLVQISLHDDQGRFLGRPDLYYPDDRLVIEYDGATHRESLAGDNRRQNRLIDADYRVLRFTASDVLGDPASVVELVRRALEPSGASEVSRPFRRRSATLAP